MIDFRYHVVSIVAVFLSLAIGLVLGANALQGPVLSAKQATNRDLHNANNNLRHDNDVFRAQVKAGDDLASGIAPQLLAGRLRGQSVVFVQTPGGSNTIYQQLTKTVQTAGAKVQGVVTIQSLYLQQDQTNLLDQLVGQLAPGLQQHDGQGTYDRAGALLASALVTKTTSQTASQDTTGILSGLTAANFIRSSPATMPRATLAIVIPPSSPDKTTFANDNKALIPLVAALADADLATVMAGPLSAAQNDGGTITALRDSGANGKVSSVDSLDTPTASSGQIVTVLALESQIATGKSGAYGTGSGASASTPNPIPTPSLSAPQTAGSPPPKGQ